MTKKILFLIFFLFSNLEYIKSQNKFDTDCFDLYQNVDSVVLSYEVFYDNETSSEFDDPFNYPSFKRSRKLSNKEVNILSKYLLSKVSYSNVYSGLSHSDIFIYYHRNAIIEKTIIISSITRDIVFIKGDELDKKRISSKKFEKYLTKLLRTKGIWTNEQEFTRFD